ncbi:MAG: D-alanyl-D-alanine carboxypeptidase family protein [Oscillospiraceae bacterium]
MNFIKKTISFTIIFGIIFSSLALTPCKASYKLPFETQSDCIYMLNLDTGTVVFQKNADKKTFPASLTKIMTAIIALENVKDLNTVITAPAYIYDELFGLGASTADIRSYEQVRMIDLLYAMMLPSACEASSIIADYVGDGNITEFVEKMNAKAKELGATNSNFTNAHGLFDENQVTTAKDMAIITEYALKLPMFKKISSTPIYTMPKTNKHAQPYNIYHTNSMIRKGTSNYKYMSGVKTGTLPEVGKNLVSTASKDGYNYLLVTIGAPQTDKAGKPLPNGSYSDAKALYDWAFSYFKMQTIINEKDVITETPVKLSSQQDHIQLLAKEDITTLLPKDANESSIQQIKTVVPTVIAPVKKGTVLGKLDLKVNNEIIATVELVSGQDVSRSGVLYGLDVTKRFFDKTLIKCLIIILILIILITIVMKARYNKIKRIKQNRERKLKNNIS